MTAWTLSIDAQICDHMVMELNQSGFIDTLRAKAETDLASMSGPYGTATRTYLPEYDHDMPQEYRVSVYPLAMSQDVGKYYVVEVFTINMVVFKRIEVGDERSKVIIEGDKVTKLADQVRKWFEWGSQRSARILDGSDKCHCALWNSCARDPVFAMGETSTYHAVFCPIVHSWTVRREISNCGSYLQRPTEPSLGGQGSGRAQGCC